MIYYTDYPSPLGQVIVAATDLGVCGIYFEGQRHFDGTGDWKKSAHPNLDKAVKQLEEYFASRRREFDLKLDLTVFGTPFQRSVWHALLAIPFGKTSSYGKEACTINKPKAVRAVGGAVGKNPISIVVPCHRVLGSNGSMTGYAGGLDRKKFLLELEGII